MVLFNNKIYNAIMNLVTFPIRILSEKTGVPTATIRAWERRYDILPAQRTESGHRQYIEEDAAYVNHLVACMEQGMTISKAIREVDNQLQQGQQLTSQVRNTQTSQWQYYIDEMLIAVAQFDIVRIDSAYQQAMGLFAVDVVTEQILCPVLVALGQRWQDRSAGVAQEHFFTTYLRNKIGARLHHQVRRHGPKLIIACMPEEYHELGSLLFAIATMEVGYSVITLGANLPLAQIPATVRATEAAGVILSSTVSTLSAQDSQELANISDLISVPLFIGGHAGLSMNFDNLYMLGSNFSTAIDRLQKIVPIKSG